jgi:hypothetical protein
MLAIMQLTEVQFNQIAELLPRQRGQRLQMVVAAAQIGKWNAAFTHMLRWNRACSIGLSVCSASD